MGRFEVIQPLLCTPGVKKKNEDEVKYENENEGRRTAEGEPAALPVLHFVSLFVEQPRLAPVHHALRRPTHGRLQKTKKY